MSVLIKINFLTFFLIDIFARLYVTKILFLTKKNPPIIISIEGNVGSGKSELIKNLKSKYEFYDNIKFLDKNVSGLILSGGPLNVYQSKKVKFNKNLLNSNIPVLGICFGHQIISKELGGKVKQSNSREFGLAKVKKVKDSVLTKDFFTKHENNVWMSHADEVTKLPKDFKVELRLRFHLRDLLMEGDKG